VFSQTISPYRDKVVGVFVRFSCAASAENLSTASNTVDVTTGTVAATYCASQGTDTNYEYIENVQLGDIDNSSTVGTG
jgi:hypothetical protein